MKLFYLFLLSISVLLFTGCATMEIQKQAKLTKPIHLDKNEIKNSSIYLQVDNIEKGGGDNINLKKNLSVLLKQKGYLLVNESKEASTKLFVEVLFVNNIKEALALQSALGYGLTGTALKYSATGSGSNALGVGLVMALGSGIAGKALEDETYRGIFAVKIENKENIHTTKVFTEVVQMNLDKKEAFNALEDISSKQISNIF